MKTINELQPGSTVALQSNRSDTAAPAVTCTRRLFFGYFSFAAKRKVSTREKHNIPQQDNIATTVNELQDYITRL